MSRKAQFRETKLRTGGTALRRKREASRQSARAREVALTYTEMSPVWEAPVGRRSVSRAFIDSGRDTFLRRTLGCADVLAAYLALLFVVMVVPNLQPVHLRLADLFIAPFVLLAAKAIGLYDRDQHVLRKTTIDEAPSLLYLAVLYALTAWLAEVLLLRGALGRPQVFALALLSFVLLAAGRIVGRAVVTARTPAERCLVVGDAVDSARITSKLAMSSGVNASVIGRVALHAGDEQNSDHLLRADGSLSNPGELARVIALQHVERVIIAPDSHDQEEILHVIRLIKALGVKVSVLPRLLEVVGSSSTFEDVDGLSLLGVHQAQASRSSESLKRVMDIAGATAGLLLLAPLLVMLAIAIKFDSRGPVFFRQRRIGRRGELFSMLKFRSMVPDAEEIKAQLRDQNEAEGGLFKITDDPRITRVGRFLRRTSLDELPQLLIVLGGSMSLVGPRPLVQDEDALIEGWQRRRLAVKPGMTGMWQIFGSSRIPMNEMVKIDYLYGANWSIWLDMKILLRTVPYVLRRRGL